MKTIPELEAEYATARQAAIDALRARDAALQTLNAAKLEASGLDGHLVEYHKSHGFRGKTVKRRFVVTRVGDYGNGLAGKVVRADGKIGALTDSVSDISKLRDLGLFVRSAS